MKVIPPLQMQEDEDMEVIPPLQVQEDEDMKVIPPLSTEEKEDEVISSLSLQDDEIMKVIPPLSPLPDTDDTKMNKTAPGISSLAADIEVSDDSDMETEEKPEDHKDDTPKMDNSKKEASHSSSEESSSSDSSCASDSDSSSSDSGEENEEEENKEEASADKEKSKPSQVANTPPDKKTNGSWALSQFITKSSPASGPNTSQTSSDLAVSKGSSSQDVSKVKTSPRKIAEIGPCNSMPFMAHDDTDPISRNCEKSSGSPDTLSTPSSHTSSLDTGRGSKNTARRDSAGDSAANSRLVTVPKPEVARSCERPQASSNLNSKVCEGASMSKAAANSIDVTESSSQQRKRRRTSSSGGAKKALKGSSAASSPIDGDSVITRLSEGKLASGKSLSCDVVEQQAVDTAGEPSVSRPLSTTYTNKKSTVSSKAKLPSCSSIQKTKSATKKTSSKEAGEDGSNCSASKTANGTLTEIGSIIKDVSVPQMLSPTIPAYSGGFLKGEELMWKGLHAPTLTCGRPSILVRLPSSCRSPQPRSRRWRSKQDLGVAKQETVTAKLATGSASLLGTSECKGGEGKQSDSKQSSVKKACGKTGGSHGSGRKGHSDSGLSASPSPPGKQKKEDTEDSTSWKKQLSASPSSPIKRVKEDTEDSTSSKKQLSASPSPLAKRKKEDTEDSTGLKKRKVPSHINKKPSPEINGVAHPEKVKKAGSKLVAERRNSGSSSSSRSSQKASSKVTFTPKKTLVTKKNKKNESNMQTEEKAINSTEGEAVNKEDLPFDSYKQPNSTPTPTPPAPSQLGEIDSDDEPLAAALNRLEPPDFYMLRAKVLKHLGDAQVAKPNKLMPYIRSVLYFIMWGYAYENQTSVQVEPQHVYSIYADTLALHNYVVRVRGPTDAPLTDKEKKLSVLILRIQSILCLKLFSFRRSEAMKLKKIIDSEASKNSSKKMSARAPSPHQNHWNKNSTGTPSPMSPTPSPACSIGSVESQGSCEQPGSKMTNGTMSSPGTIAVPQRIHSVTQKYVSHTSNLLQCHDFWELANTEVRNYNLSDFFQSIDERCGSLTLNSSLPHLVVYVHTVLKELIPATHS